MPIQIKRKIIADKYFTLEILDCPREIILFASGLAFENVTVENFSHYQTEQNLIQAAMQHQGIDIKLALKQYSLDFSIEKSEFLSLIDIWDQKGCYAIFHQSTFIKFRASDLPQIPRYKALDNFNWNLELAIPSSASDGWGQITSPDELLIQAIADAL
jgi:hypothetical protein